MTDECDDLWYALWEAATPKEQVVLQAVSARAKVFWWCECGQWHDSKPRRCYKCNKQYAEIPCVSPPDPCESLFSECDAARAVARRLLSAAALYGGVGHPPGCSPADRWLEGLAEEHPWLKEPG